MTEYEITWQQTPFVYYNPQVQFVEAANEEDAKDLVRDYIKRKFGYGNFSIKYCREAAPVPNGTVK